MTDKPKRGRPHGIYKYPDPLVREQRLAYYRMRAQAKHRGESYLLSFEEFVGMWDGLWDKRGRKPEDYCMTRVDPEEPWTTANTQVIERRYHYAQQTEIVRHNNERKPFDIWSMPNEDV